jgi:ribose/xylose/arabinose/galactoside ABC-type transport system permease subunit
MQSLVIEHTGTRRSFAARAIGTLRGVVRVEGQQLAVFLLIVVLAALFNSLTPTFLSARSLDNLLRTASMYGIVALGVTLVVMTGGIDLSVASLMALGGIIGAGLLGTAFGAANPVHLPVIVAIVIALLVTSGFGLVSGLLITRLNLAPFVVTLGVLSIARGLVFLFGSFVVQKTSGTPITFTDPVFDWLGAGMVGPVPSQMALFLLLAVAVALVLRHTGFGRGVFAVGGNVDYARLAGINTGRILMAVYAISGLLAGLGGLILTGRLSSASPIAATGYELQVITIVVIGGTSLVGGRGSILGTVLAAIVVSQIDNGLNLINFPAFPQFLIKGAVLVAAVVVDKLYSQRATRLVAQPA